MTVTMVTGLMMMRMWLVDCLHSKKHYLCTLLVPATICAGFGVIFITHILQMCHVKSTTFVLQPSAAGPGREGHPYYYEWRDNIGVSDGEFARMRVGLERAENIE